MPVSVTVCIQTLRDHTPYSQNPYWVSFSGAPWYTRQSMWTRTYSHPDNCTNLKINLVSSFLLSSLHLMEDQASHSNSETSLNSFPLFYSPPYCPGLLQWLLTDLLPAALPQPLLAVLLPCQESWQLPSACRTKLSCSVSIKAPDYPFHFQPPVPNLQQHPPSMF